MEPNCAVPPTVFWSENSCSLSRAQIVELGLGYFMDFMGLLEKFLRDSGLDKRKLHEVVTRADHEVQHLILVYFNGRVYSCSFSRA